MKFRKDLFMSVLALHGDTIESLAKKLNTTISSLNRRIEDDGNFTLDELYFILQEYALDNRCLKNLYSLESR